MTEEATFSGAKIALLCEGQLLTYVRDNKPDIPWPGQWDLPGGEREGEETPLQCALRETHEEFGLTIPPAAIVWEREYSSLTDINTVTWFYVAQLPAGAFDNVVFGDEGERWEVMPVEQYLALEDAMDHLQIRLREYLEEDA